jgi:hypothetical protein
MTDKNAVTPYGQYAGQGQEDLAIVPQSLPFLSLLQQLSPQVQEGDPKQVRGARPGMFYNTLTGDLYESLTFVVAAMRSGVLEWKPRKDGGGFVAAHDPSSPMVAAARQAAKQTKTPWVLTSPDGNDLGDTYTVSAVITDDGGPVGPVVMSFKRTAIRPFQDAISKLRNYRGAKDIPLFANEMLLTSTRAVNKAKQPYFNIVIQPANGDIPGSVLPADSPILAAAAAVRDAVTTGRSGFDYTKSGDEAAAVSETEDVVF